MEEVVENDLIRLSVDCQPDANAEADELKLSFCVETKKCELEDIVKRWTFCIVDVSGSMGANFTANGETKQRLEWVKDLAKDVASQCKDKKEWFSLITFSDSGYLVISRKTFLNMDITEIEAEITKLDTIGGTSLEGALDLVQSELDEFASGDEQVELACINIVPLSDGQISDPEACRPKLKKIMDFPLTGDCKISRSLLLYYDFIMSNNNSLFMDIITDASKSSCSSTIVNQLPQVILEYLGTDRSRKHPVSCTLSVSIPQENVSRGDEIKLFRQRKVKELQLTHLLGNLSKDEKFRNFTVNMMIQKGEHNQNEPILDIEASFGSTSSEKLRPLHLRVNVLRVKESSGKVPENVVFAELREAIAVELQELSLEQRSTDMHRVKREKRMSIVKKGDETFEQGYVDQLLALHSVADTLNKDYKKRVNEEYQKKVEEYQERLKGTGEAKWESVFADMIKDVASKLFSQDTSFNNLIDEVFIETFAQQLKPNVERSFKKKKSDDIQPHLDDFIFICLEFAGNFSPETRASNDLDFAAKEAKASFAATQNKNSPQAKSLHATSELLKRAKTVLELWARVDQLDTWLKLDNVSLSQAQRNKFEKEKKQIFVELYGREEGVSEKMYLSDFLDKVAWSVSEEELDPTLEHLFHCTWEKLENSKRPRPSIIRSEDSWLKGMMALLARNQVFKDLKALGKVAVALKRKDKKEQKEYQKKAQKAALSPVEEEN